VLLTGSQVATFPTREVFLSGSVARLHVGRLMLEAFEVATQGTQAFLAIDEFAVRQDQTKDLGISGSEIFHNLSQRRQKLFEPVVSEAVAAWNWLAAGATGFVGTGECIDSCTRGNTTGRGAEMNSSAVSRSW
jgi:hypothetical protein